MWLSILILVVVMLGGCTSQRKTSTSTTQNVDPLKSFVKSCWHYNPETKQNETTLECRDGIVERQSSFIGRDTSYVTRLLGTHRNTNSVGGFIYSFRYKEPNGYENEQMLNIYFKEGKVTYMKISMKID